MFGKILTKDLYLLEFKTITSINKIYTTLCFSENSRYAIARKKIKDSIFNNEFFYDIFTKSEYRFKDFYGYNIGEEYIIRKSALFTDKKYITKEELIMILKNLNPTYLPYNEESKTLKRKL